MNLLAQYLTVADVNSPDIYMHFPLLTDLARDSDVIVELGVRGIGSTWAFLAGRPKQIHSYDIFNPSKWGGRLEHVEQVANKIGTEFTFYQEDVLEVELPECDLILFDTWHTYAQLSQELKLHANKSKKFLVFHDVVSYGTRDESSKHEHSSNLQIQENNEEKTGILLAIKEFMDANKEWKGHVMNYFNNGLFVLKRYE